jgi:outer membrane lipoprotein-sorting protein
MRLPPALALALLLALPAPGRGEELAPGVEEVRRCMQRNLPEQSARQRVALQRTTRSGDSLRLGAELFWKRAADGRARVLVRVEEPPDERGVAFLLIEGEDGNDMFTYLPEFKTVRRITSRAVSGSFLGSDFSYEDVAELQQVARHARVERLPDDAVEGRPAHVLSGAPAPGSGSAYEKIVSYVDRETCTLARAVFLSSSGAPVKELSVPFAELTKHGERWLPRKVVLRDLQKESETRLLVEEVELDVELSDRLFTQGELARGH